MDVALIVKKDFKDNSSVNILSTMVSLSTLSLGDSDDKYQIIDGDLYDNRINDSKYRISKKGIILALSIDTIKNEINEAVCKNDL